MKKLLLAAAAAVLSAAQINAQCVSTCSTYSLSPVTYSLFATTGTTINSSFMPTADDGSLTVPIGFSFKFYCNNYTNVNVCTNGFMQFDYGTPLDFGSPPVSHGAQSFPSPTAPNGLVCLNMNDFDVSAGGSVIYSTIGTAPNRIFVLTYTSVPIWYDAVLNSPPSSVYNSGQIVLYETSNIIEIHTATVGTSPYIGTQGIENTSGTSGLMVPGRNAVVWSGGNSAYRFTPTFISVPTPPSAITGSTTLCAGVQSAYQVTLSPGASSYAWSAPGNWVGTSNTNILNATSGFSGNLQVTATYTCGTSAPSVLSITTTPAPVVSISSTPAIICSGSSVTLTPSGATAYTLEPGTLTGQGSFVVTPNVSTEYTLVGVDASGCNSFNNPTNAITVSETPTITVSSGSICAGQSFSINPVGADTYVLSNGFAVVTPVAGIYSYSVVGTATNGCHSSQVVSSLTVNAVPVLSVTANKLVICKGNPAIITAGGASTYLWMNDQASTASNTVTPTATTVYTVTGTSAEGCSKTANISITVDLCVGLAEAAGKGRVDMIVYPNPSNGEFTVDANSNVTVMIYDIQGRVVYTGALTEGSHVINMGAASAGQYLLKATDGEKAQHVILIKE